MMINSKQIEQIARIFQSQGKASPADATRPAGKTMAQDKVNLSSAGKEIQAVLQRVQDTPEVRHEKVEELRAAIRDGNYSVSGQDIAARILGGPERS